MTGTPSDMPVVLWLRRDLRLNDHPALLAACKQGPVLPLFVFDPVIQRRSGAPRVAFLIRTLRALDDDLRHYGARLVVRSGAPEHVLPAVTEEIGASAVHITKDYGPYGCERDVQVARALKAIPLLATGSPYAVSPGEIQTAYGDSFRVYSAFARAWHTHGWPQPAPSNPATVHWTELPGELLPPEPMLARDLILPAAGERAGLEIWDQFRTDGLLRYCEDRDRPDLEGTSRLSVHLKWGTLHPRTLLAGIESDIAFGKCENFAGAVRFKAELAWREFYAAVLARWPDTARSVFQPRFAKIAWENDTANWKAWTEGRTGYPLVDAGMRQLHCEGWMHNRLRMVTASFLVKDLHQDWRRGARYFMAHLIDGDLASNQHGWQWTAGTGTDAAPYHRILNPITQAKRFDPDGSYVRRWVKELRHLAVPAIFEPWKVPGGPPSGYPSPIVDHSVERIQTLASYANASAS